MSVTCDSIADLRPNLSGAKGAPSLVPDSEGKRTSDKAPALRVLPEGKATKTTLGFSHLLLSEVQHLPLQFLVLRRDGAVASTAELGCNTVNSKQGNPAT